MALLLIEVGCHGNIIIAAAGDGFAPAVGHWPGLNCGGHPGTDETGTTGTELEPDPVAIAVAEVVVHVLASSTFSSCLFLSVASGYLRFAHSIRDRPLVRNNTTTLLHLPIKILIISKF